MATVEGDTIKISIPFALPFLGLHEPTTLNINKPNLQFAVRLIVVFCTILLFWPRLRDSWRAATGTDEAKKREINERIAKLERERAATSPTVKQHAVVEGTAKAKMNTEKGGAKKRKA